MDRWGGGGASRSETEAGREAVHGGDKRKTKAQWCPVYLSDIAAIPDVRMSLGAVALTAAMDCSRITLNAPDLG